MVRNSYLTLTVRNLPLGTTKEDIIGTINRLYQNAQPVVGLLVKDANRASLSATVTIRQDTDEKCRQLRDNLNLKDFFPRAPETEVVESKIVVNDEFLGVTTVAEHENAQFDIYFIHGLGGHAFRSWATDKGFPQMWPRDFLPNDVRERPLDPKNPNGPRLAGRFSTIGYRASTVNTWSATTTIDRAAENLLGAIATDRPEGSDRPMYFACHSLGGLVTCQALITALRNDGNRTERTEEYRKIFFQNGLCLVKGVFFFGTPFEGSKLANNASRIVKFLRGNEALIESLKVHSSELAAIVGKFDQVRSNPDTKIPILIAYEMRPMFDVKFVTDPESAMSSFDVHPIGIEGDHRTMIKFPHNQDKSYREVSEFIIRTIQTTLSGLYNTTPSSSPKGGSHAAEFSPSPLNRTGTMASVQTLPPYPGISRQTTVQSQYGTSVAGPSRQSSTSSDYFNGGGPPVRQSSTRSLPMRNGSQSRVNSNSWLHGHSPMGGSTNREAPITEEPAVAPIKFQDIVQSENTAGGREGEKNEFTLLSQFDTVFLLDDTGSMAEPTNPDDDEGMTKWDELVESLQHTVDIVCRYDKDGVDVRFFCNDEKDETQITEGQRILDLLTKEVGPDERGGGTYIGEQLWLILTTYLDKFEDWRKRMHERPRPEKPKMLNLIVVTDGAADDKEQVEDVIVEAAKRLDEMRAQPQQVGIQFLQIGRDEDAARWLKLLDDSLKEKHGVRDVRFTCHCRWFLLSLFFFCKTMTEC
ncbi:hypothetical protein B0H66DRAFT_74682 [Apodospora peruviana]|uniref:VWFA domain-containing protein n=1 Tax=Apodospora peruviana TaxID=516989 RepID=A0AAE0MH37_9PEZI|nr:hypothetical protein B0H66DRAFT_74682 [Apodospora peruviana]